MSASKLRAEIKKAINTLPIERLEAVADFVNFLRQPTIHDRLKKAKSELAAGKGTDWRKVRSDV